MLLSVYPPSITLRAKCFGLFFSDSFPERNGHLFLIFLFGQVGLEFEVNARRTALRYPYGLQVFK